MIGYLLTAALGSVAGYLVGTRRARKVQRRVVQQMNLQSLELLEANSKVNRLQAYANKHQRKDRLLKLALTRLQLANRELAASREQAATNQRRHTVALSRMRVRALEARETARKAAAIARKATFHLRRLEKVSPVTQTIEAPEPKSYGNSDPVTVSVVDQSQLDGTAESIVQVSNRDSARLSKLRSSNEATAG